jgi:hypothetical protein
VKGTTLLHLCTTHAAMGIEFCLRIEVCAITALKQPKPRIGFFFFFFFPSPFMFSFSFLSPHHSPPLRLSVAGLPNRWRVSVN